MYPGNIIGRIALGYKCEKDIASGQQMSNLLSSLTNIDNRKSKPNFSNILIS